MYKLKKLSQHLIYWLKRMFRQILRAVHYTYRIQSRKLKNNDFYVTLSALKKTSDNNNNNHDLFIQKHIVYSTLQENIIKKKL